MCGPLIDAVLRNAACSGDSPRQLGMRTTLPVAGLHKVAMGKDGACEQGQHQRVNGPGERWAYDRVTVRAHVSTKSVLCFSGGNVGQPLGALVAHS